MLKSLIVVATASVLISCGGAEEAATSDAPVSEKSALPAGSAGPADSAPGAVSSADTLTFAKDGDTIGVKVGEEVSVKLELPGDALTSVQWGPVDKRFPEHVKELRTYRSVEGKQHYSDVIITGVEAGSGAVTLAKLEKGTPVDEVRLTLTLVVE